VQKLEAILCGESVTLAVKSYVEVGVKLPIPEVRSWPPMHHLSVVSIKKLRSGLYDETSEKLVRWKEWLFRFPGWETASDTWSDNDDLLFKGYLAYIFQCPPFRTHIRPFQRSPPLLLFLPGYLMQVYVWFH
jgi:hypothetical protein